MRYTTPPKTAKKRGKTVHKIKQYDNEVPVPVEMGEQITEQCCEKLSDSQYRIAERDISLPVNVGDASMLMNIFTVDAGRARALLVDSGFEPVELWPGKALMQLLGVDYRQNDLGDYNEAAIIFPVTTPGQPPVKLPVLGALRRMATGKLDNFVYRMPVDQGFTTHAGRFIWGFPKWVSQVDFEMDEKRARTRFADQGELVFEIQAAAGGKTRVPEQAAPSLAIRNGQAWRTVGSTQGEGLTFRLGGRKPEIGNKHPLALLLRELGLPKRPLCTVSMRRAQMTFPAAEPVKIGQPFSAERELF